MKLNAKNPQLALTGCWKMTRLRAELRLKEYNEQKAAASAAAAAEAAEAKAVLERLYVRENAALWRLMGL